MNWIYIPKTILLELTTYLYLFILFILFLNLISGFIQIYNMNENYTIEIECY